MSRLTIVLAAFARTGLVLIAAATLIAAAGCGTRSAPVENPLDEKWAPSEEDFYPAAVDVRIEPIAERGGHRFANEVAGLLIALYEAGLADLPDVVPHYDAYGPPPGIDRWLTGESSHWDARFSISYERDAVQIVLELCPAGGECMEGSASGPREAPEGAVTELLVWSAGLFGVPVPAGIVETWSRPLSADRYAVLILGRAAATMYGLVDPISPAHRGLPRKDPLTRALLIDPSLSLTQYLIGRRALEIGDAESAARAFEKARIDVTGRFAFEVAAAAAANAGGDWALARKLWDEVESRWPLDSRFVVPRVEAYLASGLAVEARSLLLELPPRFDKDPAVAKLRVEIAEAVGPGEDYERLVAAWEEAAAYDPEPVRRHIALRLRDGRFEEAFELLAKLEARGAATEAREMMIALGAEIGRFADAAKQAAIMGNDSLAKRLRLRAALEQDSRNIPIGLVKARDPDLRLLLAKLQLPRDADKALADVRAVLREDRFRAEAIAIEVRALEQLGRWDEAVAARERLQFADPALVSGPRTVAGLTSTGSQAQVSLAE